MSTNFTPKPGLGQASDFLSKRFTLRDLTKTDQKTANMPNEAQLANLKKLAQVLDYLYDKVGPFQVISAFRSQATQDALKAGGAGDVSAQMAATNSLHSTGEAADIYPTTMSLEAYFVRLFALPEVKERLGQIVIKERQNALHISTPTGRFPAGTPMKDVPGVGYVRLTIDEINDWMDEYPIATAVAGIVGAALAGLSTFFLVKFLRKKKLQTLG